MYGLYVITRTWEDARQFKGSKKGIPLLIIIAWEKPLFSTKKYQYFSDFSMKTYIMGTY